MPNAIPKAMVKATPGTANVSPARIKSWRTASDSVASRATTRMRPSGKALPAACRMEVPSSERDSWGWPSSTRSGGIVRRSPTSEVRSGRNNPTCVTTAGPPFMREVIMKGNMAEGRAASSSSCSLIERSSVANKRSVAFHATNSNSASISMANIEATISPQRRPRLRQSGTKC